MEQSHLQITLFGAPQIYRGQKYVDGFITNKVLALFCYLAVTRQPHTRDALAGMFWAEMPNTDARTNLRKALSNLRKLFPDAFIINRRTVAFNTDTPHTSDVTEFLALITPPGTSETAADTVTRLEKAVALYQGEFLAGFYLPDAETFSEWVLGWREHLGEHALQAIYTLAKASAENRQYAQAVDYYRKVLAIDPWREAAHRQLMLVLARMGERNAAIAQYHTCREILSAELGILPDTETRLLYERIEAAGSTPLTTLPQQPAPFIGRTTELHTATTILLRTDCRMLTVTGLGGIGKTRLAIRLAEMLTQHFLDGVFFVPLATVHNEQSLLQAIGSAIRFAFGSQGDPIEQLSNFLKPRETLLVLDNFEHLTAIHSILEDLLEKTTGLKLLITSRQKLHSRWEHTLALSGFNLDENTEHPPVLDLFTQNARRVRPNFTLSVADRQTVLAISRELAGIPLGIELAARWVSTLSCPEILQNIRRELTFLDGATAAANSRHSLQAVLTYTWEQLSAAEQLQFSRLTVFDGAFTADAAAKIADTPLNTLARFVTRGLISAVPTDTAADSPQFEMHQLWQQFARTKLAALPQENQRIRRQHARYYLALLAEYTDTAAPHSPTAPATVNSAFNNILSGWKWLLAHGDTHDFITATNRLQHYLFVHNRYGELKIVQEEAIARITAADTPAPVQSAQWYRQLGETYFRLGQLPQSLKVLHKTLLLLKRPMPANLMQLIPALGMEIIIQTKHRLWQGKQHRADAPPAAPFLIAAQTYERLGQILFFENTPTPTLLLTSLRGMNLAERVTPSAVLARLYGNMILGFGLVPIHRLAQFYRQLALNTAQRAASPAAKAWVLEVSSIYWCGIGQWKKAAEDARQAINLSITQKDTRRQDECRVMPAHIAHWHGDFRRSAEIWLDIYASAYNRGDVQAQRWGLCGQAENFLPLGRVEETVSHITAALNLPLKIEDIGTDISCYGVLANAYFLQKNYDHALDAAENGLRLVKDTAPAAFSSLGGYIGLANVYLRLWTLDASSHTLANAADDAVTQLWRFSRVFSIGKPAALLYRGMLAWRRTKPKQAIRQWEKGIAAARTLQMSYHAAQIFAEMAQCLPDGHPQKPVAAARAAELFKKLNLPVAP